MRKHPITVNLGSVCVSKARDRSKQNNLAQDYPVYLSVVLVGLRIRELHAEMKQAKRNEKSW